MGSGITMWNEPAQTFMCRKPFDFQFATVKRTSVWLKGNWLTHDQASFSLATGGRGKNGRLAAGERQTYHRVFVEQLDDNLRWVPGNFVNTAINLNILKDQGLIPSWTYCSR